MAGWSSEAAGAPVRVTRSFAAVSVSPAASAVVTTDVPVATHRPISLYSNQPDVMLWMQRDAAAGFWKIGHKRSEGVTPAVADLTAVFEAL